MSKHDPGYMFFFFNDTATTEIYTLSLHDALPIFPKPESYGKDSFNPQCVGFSPNTVIVDRLRPCSARSPRTGDRSEEHTSELQSRSDLVCRLLLEKKK